MHFHMHVNKSIANIVVPGYELEHSMIVDNVVTWEASSSLQFFLRRSEICSSSESKDDKVKLSSSSVRYSYYHRFFYSDLFL